MFSSSTNPCPCCDASGASQTYQTYPSPPAEMLSSNAVFSINQTRKYSKTIADMEVDMSRLDDEMSRLRKAMDHLGNERQKLERSLDEHRSLTAPIRRIPQEILSEIFLHCLSEGSDSFDVTIAPLLLTFVCSRWRTVATFTPRLWSSISLTSSIATEMLQTWLSRSGISPLTIYMDSETPEGGVIANPCIDTLISHSHHWHDVTFMLEAAQYNRLAAAKGHLPMLERLNLDAYGSFLAPLDAFEVAPKLHTIEINANITQCGFPWQQLRQCYVRCQWSQPSKCFYILQQCTNVIHCTLDSYGDVDDIPPNALRAPLLRTQLQTLHLVSDEHASSCHMLSALTAPTLLDLEIGLEDYTYGNPSIPSQTDGHLSSFLARSSCNLRRFCLRETVLTSDELITCLHQLLSLVELEIKELLYDESGTIMPTVTAQTLRRMTHDVSGSCVLGSLLLVPRLKRLTLSAHFDLDDQVILDMVQSRRGFASFDGNSSVDGGLVRVESLELVALHVARELQPDTITQMALWKEGALEVRVKSLGKCVV